MAYIKAEQVLCNEELCPEPITEESAELKTTKLFRENMRLAISIASKYKYVQNPRISEEDITQTALLSLWEVCLKYDESTGNRFSTYAYPSIDGSIKRLLRDDNPLKMSRASLDIRGILYKHNFQLPLTEEEIDIIVSEGGVDRKHLEQYSEPILLNIDSTISNHKGDSEPSISDIIPDPRATVGEEYTADDIESIITNILQYIKPLHREMIEEWLYSIADGEELKQRELALKYNITQSYIARILQGAKKLLKSYEQDIRELFGY